MSRDPTSLREPPGPPEIPSIEPHGSADGSVEPAPSRGRRRHPFGWLLLALMLIGLGVLAVRSGQLERLWGHDHHAGQGQRYQCPMHPTVTSDRPGDCPICGMKLVPVAPALSPSTSSSSGARKIVHYRSPMNPQQTSPVPMKDEMGMDYLPVYEDELHTASSAGSVPGMVAVTIDPTRQQLIGLRTALVTKGSVGRSWRTVGRLESDPTRVRKTNVKVDGYVERIFVDFVGKPVGKGQPLFALYSPNLLSAQTEYLLAKRTSAALHGDAGVANDPLVMAARRKLELWDVPQKAIDELERTGEPTKTLTFVSPISGYVTAKNIVEGSRLNVGDTPYEVTDLSMVWLMADAYESDLAHVKVGMTANLTLAPYVGQVFSGKVEFIDPTLDPKSRTLKLHIHFMNPKGLLKPGMYGEVQLQEAERTGLRIPFDAVIASGTSHVVFLALDDGKFQPQEVHLGPKSGEFVEVVKGLSEGQKVVTRANFLVDSESRLRASLSAMSPQ